ncbi:succinylglutamate desuccinylase/aspartoacylase family protein [Bradyrhizobium sp. ARR65]|uniref:succinylglutamate desuccinylase/aspartoacylase domain-containing protein n=1 Tax=Bradyrhizobium sp. ARR65 TaxID=1040989 RepID=UPI0004651153|nr:succinylglutamate desuccinylase/aspartoacylase family protein [Bradyrhizobium sp. ARR65]
MTDTRAQAQPIIEYPVEFSPPNIGRWRDGTTGVPFVHSFAGARPGPHLLITALVHGNEPAGAVALDRLLSQGLNPSRGRLTLAFANVDAYARFDPSAPRASRWVEEDMNRIWSSDILDASPRSADVARAVALRPFVEQADYLLDLHTTQHPNEPLVLAGPHQRSRELARKVGVADLVVVDRGHAQGPRMRDYGGFGDPCSAKTALLIECGQHWAASSGEVAYAACIRMLQRLDMAPPAFEAPTVSLPDEPSRFIEITMPVTIKHEFVFALPLRGGEIIPRAGTVIGHDGGEPVVTPHDDCFVLMPSQRLWAGLTAVRLGRLIPAS